MRADPPVNQVARWVSILLHPFAVFAVLALVAASVLDPASLPRVAMGIAVAIGVVWVFVAQRKRSGHWGTVDASNRHERPVLYLLLLAVAAGYWLWIGPDSVVAKGVLAVVAMLCIAGIANRWIKLSLHMTSLAFATIAFAGISVAAAVVALSLLPLLAWSRLRMARHTVPEVIGGTMLGLVAGASLHWLF